LPVFGSESVRVKEKPSSSRTLRPKIGEIANSTFASGNPAGNGPIIVTAETLSIASNGAIVSDTFSAGKAGSVSVNVPGQLTIDGTAANTNNLTGIASDAEKRTTGDAGNVTVNAGTLSILNNGSISSNTFGAGKAGSVSVYVPGQLTIDGTAANSSKLTGIASDVEEIRTGDAGKVTVNAGTLSILSNGKISSNTFGTGNAGNVAVAVSGQLTIDGAGGTPTARATGIFSQANPTSGGAAGAVSVWAGALSIRNSREIASSTFAPGNADSVTVAVSGGWPSTARGRISWPEPLAFFRRPIPKAAALPEWSVSAPRLWSSPTTA
jgi:large exoprotein involved in heme utilization and adhesion